MNGALIQRLEQADPKWLFEVVCVDVAGGEVLVCGRLSLKGTGRTMFGSCRMEGRSLGDAANVAAGAALEQAAAELGIHAACRRRNMPMGELADTLAQRWGKTAPQFLTKREASELLDELSANGVPR